MKKPAKTANRSKASAQKTPLLDRRGGSSRLLAADGVVENLDQDLKPDRSLDDPPSDLPFDPIPLDEVFRRSVYDLERSVNAYGREIFVEQWEENTLRPKIWYEFNRQRILVKYTRTPTTIQTTYLGKTHYL
jgi:hypothetical protein